MNAKHTPGPWEQGNGYGCGNGYAICAGPQILARVNGFGYPLGIGWDAESEANARLIAAAPELLEALRAIHARIEGIWDEPALVAYGPLSGEATDCARIARAAIAKATGT